MSREGTPPNGNGENIIPFHETRVQMEMDSLRRLIASQEISLDDASRGELEGVVGQMQDELLRIIREDKDPNAPEAIRVFVGILKKTFPRTIPRILRSGREKESDFQQENIRTFDLRASILEAHPLFREQPSQAKSTDITLALQSVASQVKHWAEHQLGELAQNRGVSSKLQTAFLGWMISICVELRLLLGNLAPRQRSLELFLPSFEDLFNRLGETQKEVLNIEELKDLLSQWETIWEEKLAGEVTQSEIAGGGDPVRDAGAAYRAAFLLHGLLSRFFFSLQEEGGVSSPRVFSQPSNLPLYSDVSGKDPRIVNECIRAFLPKLADAAQTEIQDKQEAFALIGAYEQKKDSLFLAGAMALVQIWLMLLTLSSQEHTGEGVLDKTGGGASGGLGATPKLQTEILRDVLRIAAARNPAFEEYLHLVGAGSVIPDGYPGIDTDEISTRVSDLVLSYSGGVSTSVQQTSRYARQLGDNIVDLSAYRAARHAALRDDPRHDAALFARVCLVSALVETALVAGEQLLRGSATDSVAILEALASAIERLADEDRFRRFIPKE
ncbi:MAG: hypothetical protein KatS3mg099_393 [Candidatus Parcubacteria bacterium]|nr:MAG: hypothetical protein KatS3mg099_393 [Candidatus Parcubacteria bacterium]